MSNKETIGKILGPYWPELLGDGLNSLLEVHADSADAAEASIARLRAMFGEPTAENTLGLSTRAFDIPTSSISRAIANGSDSSALYGDGAFDSQFADDMGWLVTLPEALYHKPLLVPGMNSELLFLEGVDYVSEDEWTIRIFSDPFTCGFTESLAVDEDGYPATTLKLVFPMSGDNDGGYVKRYGFHRVPEEIRTQVFDLLVNEGSTQRLLSALSAALGVTTPSVFDKADEDGSYTSVLRYWVDGEYAYGWTSGGELIKAPLAYNPTFTHGSTLDAGTSLVTLLGVYDKVSDSSITGLWFKPAGTNGLVVLNTDVAVGSVVDSIGGEQGYQPTFNLQIRGSTEDKDAYYAGLSERLASYGTSLGTLFDAGTANPMELLYDGMGRKQPPVIQVINEAAERLAGTGSLLTACTDSIPSGSGLIVDMALAKQEICVPSIEEELTAFILYDTADTLPMDAMTTETTRQGTVLS